MAGYSEFTDKISKVKTTSDLLKNLPDYTEKDAISGFGEDTKKYYAGGTDTEESQNIEDLTQQLTQTPEKIRQVAGDVEKSQAIESIVGNLVKAFAAYSGMKANTDMSGVDVKTGIDWKSVLQGKMSALDEEAKGLKETREITRQRLSDRIKAAQSQVEGEARRGTDMQTMAWKAMHEQLTLNQKQQFEAGQQALKLKTEKEIAEGKKKTEEKKSILTGFMQSGSKLIENRENVAKEIGNSIKYLAAPEPDKDLSLEDTAKRQQAIVNAANILKVQPEYVQKMSPEDRTALVAVVQQKVDEETNTARIFKNRLNELQTVGEKLGPEQVAEIKFYADNADRLSGSLPEGKVLLPIDAPPGDEKHAAQAKLAIDYMQSDAQLKAKLLARAKLVEKSEAGTFWDSKKVDALQQFIDGKPIDYANFPSELLDGVPVDRIRSIGGKPVDIAREMPNAIIGIGK